MESSSSDGGVEIDSFLDRIPSIFRARLISAAESHTLDLSNSSLVSLPLGLNSVPGLVSLNLSTNFLTEQILPLLASTSLASLIITNNQISEVSVAFFESVPALQTLLIGRNSLREFPALPESCCTRLSVLDLHCNDLFSLPENFGHALSTLRTLGLSSNKLNAVPLSLGLLALGTLDLSNNFLETLPDFIENERLCRTLTTLNLANNEFAAFPMTVLSMTSLTTLDFSLNFLTAIPPAISQLSLLTNLNLSRNQISSLPDSICSLINLTDFDLSENQLTSFNFPNLGHLGEQLMNLNLRGNRLQDISPHLFEITCLATLDISSNYLDHHQTSMLGALSYLSTLDIARNPISSLPVALSDISFLNSVNLNYLALKEFPMAICSIPFLKTLRLASNEIEFIPEQIGQLVNLEILDLSHNAIHHVSEALLSLTSLVTLSLGFNQISLLPDKFGSTMPALENLFLSHNLIEGLPSSIGLLRSLQCLQLSSNRIPRAKRRTSSVGQKISDLPVDKENCDRPGTPHRSNSDADEFPNKNTRSEAHRSNSDVDKLPKSTLIMSAHRSNSNADKDEKMFRNTEASLQQQDAIWNLLAPLHGTLRHLYISSNALELVPYVITQLTSLQHLDLSCNRLTHIPPELKSLTRLSTLVLSHNQLSDISPEVLAVPSLSYLASDSNRLTQVPNIHDGTRASFMLNPIDLQAKSGGIPYHYITSPIVLTASSSQDVAITADLPNPKIGYMGMNGLRQRMEDGIFVHESPNEFFVTIFDGHDGREVSHLAAHSVYSVFTDVLRNSPEPTPFMPGEDFIVSEKCFHTHRIPCDGTDPALLEGDAIVKVMELTIEKLDNTITHFPGGTTAILIYQSNGFVYVANVGDCRAVLCRDGAPLPLTVDHTPRSIREQKRLQQTPGSYIHQGRTRGVLAVTRALGDINLRPSVCPLPDFSRIRLTSRDSFILVACDGFWDVFPNDVAIRKASQLLSQTQSPSLTALLLRDAAFAHGSTDNISVCVIQL